jgi:hypothetical protein
VVPFFTVTVAGTNPLAVILTAWTELELELMEDTELMELAELKLEDMELAELKEELMELTEL